MFGIALNRTGAAYAARLVAGKGQGILTAQACGDTMPVVVIVSSPVMMVVRAPAG